MHKQNVRLIKAIMATKNTAEAEKEKAVEKAEAKTLKHALEVLTGYKEDLKGQGLKRKALVLVAPIAALDTEHKLKQAKLDEESSDFKGFDD